MFDQLLKVKVTCLTPIEQTKVASYPGPFGLQTLRGWLTPELLMKFKCFCFDLRLTLPLAHGVTSLYLMSTCIKQTKVNNRTTEMPINYN